MIGFCSRVNVFNQAKLMGYEFVQVDGIPEGFSFREPDINISGIDIRGEYVAFIPNSLWVSVRAPSTQQLLEAYKVYE